MVHLNMEIENEPALLNSASQNTAATYLRKCCSSEEWITRMLRQRPFRDSDAVHAAADSAWIDLESKII
ncbi:MAG: hypothetical protein CM15mP125_3070 [Gammaproteobacteria bacterium]|nr:MAG: hypothetical protein CM15mP125_3070 [Gammaproteobacteria bacterium]